MISTQNVRMVGAAVCDTVGLHIIVIFCVGLCDAGLGTNSMCSIVNIYIDILFIYFFDNPALFFIAFIPVD